MKKWLYLLSLVVPVLIMMHAPQSAFPAVPDTVTVNATGKNNKVILNSRQSEASFSGKVDAPVKGEIIQKGENNSVEINSGRGCSGDRIQKESQDLKGLKASSGSGSIIMEKQVRQHIKVKQSGKNNSVKINSR